MKFVELLEKQNNLTRTENNAVALKSTGNVCVDLFGKLGAMRDKPDFEIEKAFSKAWNENKLLTMKMLFFARDIRNIGLGERRVFRIGIKYLANMYPESMAKNLDLISEFGRWDDILVLLDTPLEEEVLSIIVKQLTNDIKDDYPSLLAKWMPSENASSQHTISKAKKIRKMLGFSSKTYRKLLSKLRKRIGIVERQMSSNNWEDIDFEKVPSRAMMIYRDAFFKHQEERFEEYINQVSKGEKKINAGTLYPYDIVKKMLQKYRDTWNVAISDLHDATLEELWKNLPELIDDTNTLIMADVSGSMFTNDLLPISTSVGLATYFAERNKGEFANKFMTFSNKPELVTLQGNSLAEKIYNLIEANWNMNTDFEAALMLILQTAVANDVKQEDLPKALIVISDMQFDMARMHNYDKTFYETVKEQYNKYGYEIPNLIFWNVNAKRDSFQAFSDTPGVQLASGHSVNVFKSVLNAIGMTPYEAMIETLSHPIFDNIKI